MAIVDQGSITNQSTKPFKKLDPSHRDYYKQQIQITNQMKSQRNKEFANVYKNPAEAEMLVNLFRSLNRIEVEKDEAISSCTRDIGNYSRLKGRVGVLTPYALQLQELKKVFKAELGEHYESIVELNSIDGFQGKEKDFILISCVRSGGTKGVGFLSDIRRMNVGLTRAKCCCIVVGRKETLIQNPHWKNLIEHAHKTGALVCAPSPRCDIFNLKAVSADEDLNLFSRKYRDNNQQKPSVKRNVYRKISKKKTAAHLTPK